MFALSSTNAQPTNDKKMKRIILLIVCCFVLLVGHAQEHFVFSPIDSHDGLSENGVRSVTQLPDGRMVIMTDGLVNLYDGISFRYLHINDGDVYPLKGYHAYHHSYIDVDGQLWIKDYQRLLLFDIRKEIFVSHLDSVLLGYGVESPLSDFFMDTESNFWYLTQDDKLLHRRASDSQATVFLPKVSSLVGKDDRLKDVAVYQNNVFFFFRSGSMICFGRDSQQELFREKPLAGKKEIDQNQIILVTPHEHYLYKICNDYHGLLLRYDIKKRMWETVLEQDCWLNTLSIDSEGDIWLSSPHGLWSISKDLRQKRHFTELQLLDGRMSRLALNALFHDKQGGLWLGTAKSGLLYYHPDRFKFKNIGRQFFDIPLDHPLRVNCFVDRGEDVFVGTTAGLFLYSRHNKQVTRSDILPGPIEVVSMLKDRKGRIWISCGSAGLYCIDGQKKRHYPVSPDKHCRLYENKDGSLYLCKEKGFGLFNPETGEYSSFRETERMNVVYQLVEYEENALVGLSDMGIFIFNRKTGLLQLTGTYEKQRPEMFRQNNYRYDCLCSDSRGLVWMGTRDGLSVWNKTQKKLQVFHTEDELINNRIQSITEDVQGNIWVSTSNGISRIKLTKDQGCYQYTFSNFNRLDGVITNEFFERSVCRIASGSLLWGGIDGFNEIDPKSVYNLSRSLPKPLFTRLFLFGAEIKPGRKYNNEVLLQQSVAATQELHLDYNQNFITFEFSALNYINTTQTYYRFQLLGVDEHPQEIASPNGVGRANYTNLSPGVYTLKVYAGNNNKEWSEQFAQMQIVIDPPFWKTTLAYFVYLILFLSVFYFATSHYLKWSKRKMEMRQREDLERMKYTFFTNVSHELRTPLTLILTPLDTLLRKLDEGPLKTQLTGIYRNAASLLQIVNQLLDFRRIEVVGEILRLSYCHIGEFVAATCRAFEQLAHSKDICFRFETHENDLYAHVDTDKLQKIINNLLSNALKFTPNGGEITVRLTRDKGAKIFTVQVIDSGKGIPEKELQHIFTRFYQIPSENGQSAGSGIGLHLVQEYVLLHKGDVRVESRENEGCVFSVDIPIDLKITNTIDDDSEAFVQDQGALKILIVEDNDEFRAFLTEQLSHTYVVQSASNGVEGLARAVEWLPDLIISDIMMPEMDGIEMCKRLKKEVKISHTPVILLTARSSDDAQIEGYESGADAYISKPFNMDILLLRISNLIEQQTARKELFRKTIVIQPQSITSSSVDETFIANALKCIERNFDNPSYSVEQLARDMNMDRTGLYRKLVAVVGQSPTLFIRSIRLKKAAQLLLQGLTVSEVSELVGFGTIGYFSKCFQEEFAVKPSLYAKK